MIKIKKQYSTYGVHALADLYGVNPLLLDNLSFLKKLCKTAVKKSGATLLKLIEYKFEPQRVSLALLLSESHLTIHTSPEHGYVSIDIYTCGRHCNPEKAIDYIIENLNPDPNRIYRQKFIRGIE